MASLLPFPTPRHALAGGASEHAPRTSDIAPRPESDLGRLVDGLHTGEVWAERQLLERFSGHVERVLVRVVGDARDVDDLTQEVFLRVLTKIDALQESEALPGFITSIAIFVAREQIRARRRKRWLVFAAPEDLPEMTTFPAPPEARRAMVAFYRVLRGLDEDLQIFLALRWLEGMELAEIAKVSSVSVATVKRRIAQGEILFRRAGRLEPELLPWLEEPS